MKTFKEFICESMTQQDWKDLYIKVINGEEYSAYYGLDGKIKKVDINTKEPYVYISREGSPIGVSFSNVNGLHRLDGPARMKLVPVDNGRTSQIREEFWIDGKQYLPKDYWKNAQVRAVKEGGQDAADLLDI